MVRKWVAGKVYLDREERVYVAVPSLQAWPMFDRYGIHPRYGDGRVYPDRDDPADIVQSVEERWPGGPL